jgi:hypothetical protein
MEVQAKVDLQDVVWGEWPFEHVSATAASLRSDPSLQTNLKASGVEVVGRTKLEPLLAWLGERLHARTVEADRDGRINVVRRRFGPRVIIRTAEVKQGLLEVELHALSWFGVRLRPPAGLRWTRVVELPRLPLSVSIVEARRDEDTVQVRLTIPSLSWSAGHGGLQPDRRASS